MKEKLNIILIDDDPGFVEGMSLWLRMKGYSVSVALSGAKAIGMIEQQRPHIVFLDLKMPDMDGVQTLKCIRQINQKLPVVIVTAYPDEEKFSQTQQLNVSGFFYKGDDLKELQKIIDFTLKTYQKIWER